MKQRQSGRLLLSAFLLAAATGHRAAATRQNHFSDVPPTHWAYDAVNELADLGILVGYPAAPRTQSPVGEHKSGQRKPRARSTKRGAPRRNQSHPR